VILPDTVTFTFMVPPARALQEKSGSSILHPNQPGSKKHKQQYVNPHILQQAGAREGVPEPIFE
jgi:hypothetical protein